MNCTEINKLVKDLADLVRFHELETVDEHAVRLLEQADAIPEAILDSIDEHEDWIEEIRQANMVKTAR